MKARVTCEPGRTIAVDGVGLVYLSIIRNKETQAFAIQPADADYLADYIAETLDWEAFQVFLKARRGR